MRDNRNQPALRTNYFSHPAFSDSFGTEGPLWKRLLDGLIGGFCSKPHYHRIAIEGPISAASTRSISSADIPRKGAKPTAKITGIGTSCCDG
jgi:hypothetical protein